MPTVASARPSEYYQHPDVQARMLEDLGGTAEGAASAAYLSGLGPDDGPFPHWEAGTIVLPQDIARLWAAGADIARALWDHTSLILLIDIDYQNIDEPAEAFLRPAEVFVKLEPTYRAVRRVLAHDDVHPLAVVTGRGYHFTGRIPLASPVVATLADLAGATPAWFWSVDERRLPGVRAQMTERQARAWYGLGLVTEFVAHEILAEAQPESRIPLVVNGTIVGRGTVGRECTSVDFSHFGDPLDVRHMRVPFSTYQWHRLRPDIFGWTASHDIPPFVALPRARTGLLRMLGQRQSLMAGVEAAATASPPPDLSAGVALMAERYRTSALATFHRAYLAAWRAKPGNMPAVDLPLLPPCVRATLERPNDLLLKPAHVQHLVRELVALGHSPADIARLVLEKYEEDHAWGRRWNWMHAPTRAEFDVRVFAGLLATGHDALVDFNCVSAQEKDLCPGLPCRRDLRDDRERIWRVMPSRPASETRA